MAKVQVRASRTTGGATARGLQEPGRIKLVLHTRKACALVRGRRADSEQGKAPITGLLLFAATVGRIWHAAAADDPYADWWLVEIEHQMETAREEIGAYRKQVSERLRQAPLVDLEAAVAAEPAEIELRFGTPYGFMASYLLVDYDGLVREVMTARHVAVLDREAAERLIHEGGRAVRRAFHSAEGYRYLALTRDDVRQGTAKARKARELMGELPRQVLEGKVRARHAPVRRARPEPEAAAAAGGGGGSAA